MLTFDIGTSLFRCSTILDSYVTEQVYPKDFTNDRIIKTVLEPAPLSLSV